MIHSSKSNGNIDNGTVPCEEKILELISSKHARFYIINKAAWQENRNNQVASHCDVRRFQYKDIGNFILKQRILFPNVWSKPRLIEKKIHIIKCS